MLILFTEAQARLERAGVSVLGRLVWWSLGPNSIADDDLRRLAVEHGLDERFLPQPINPAGVSRRAVRHAASGLGQGLLLRKISETSEAIVVGLVQERPDEVAKNLDYELKGRVSFDKRTCELRREGSQVLLDEVERLYQRHLLLSTDDIRATITSFLGETGIALRRSGGVHFVPHSRGSELVALIAVVEDAGPNEVRTLGIFDTPRDRSVLQDAARRTLDDELKSLETELESYDPLRVRDSTLERRVTDFEQLRQRAALFQNVLGLRAEDLARRVLDIQRGLHGFLKQSPEERAANVPLPSSEPHPQPELETSVAGF
ncbi:MAG: DUF6744 family protein [Myxococcota bacterium]